jgi:carbonic anhydrase/acetyltransferase-like protein (isoleucine patch superfamily)|nr:MAG TPA: Putative transferase, nesg, ydcK, Structural Genomics.38A [Caudoviricetes sp.]
MEDKKYELVPETVTKFYSKPTYRIRALKDFSDVKKGQYGGYVESEENLSQSGNCWIYDDSIVGSRSRVLDNAIVKDSSKVINGSEISDDAIIEKGSLIDESSVVCDRSRVISSLVTESSAVIYSSIVNEDSMIEQGSTVFNAIVGPKVYVKNGAVIRFDINGTEDYAVYSNPFSYSRSLTASTKKDIWSCEPHADTAEKLREFLIEDEVLEEGDEYLKWYDSIVAFHKNYFNIQ